MTVILGPSDDFWHDDDSIVVEEQPPIAVYTNTKDAIVVRQLSGDEDVVVVVRPENVLRVVRAMLGEVGLDHLLLEQRAA